MAIYFYTRVSVKRVTNEEHKEQSLPFSISYFMCSAVLSLALIKVEERRSDLLSKLPCCFLSVSDGSAFEKTVVNSDSLSNLSKSGSSIKHFVFLNNCFVCFLEDFAIFKFTDYF